MKTSEINTLIIGFIIIAVLGYFGKAYFIFTDNQIASNTSNNQTIKTPMTIQDADKNLNPVTGLNISSDPHMKVIDVSVGTGTEAKTGSKVSVQYVGMLPSGSVFDSSIPRGKPFEFVLGQGKVIKGWDLGLVGMKVGGKRRLVLDPDYGYGAAGYPPVIPQSSFLIFDVELVGVK